MDRRQSGLTRALSWLISGGRPAASHLLLAPASLWLLCFLVIPVAFLLALSLTERGPYGSFVWTFSTDNFQRALDAKYLPVLLRTFAYAGMTTVCCLLLGFPLA